jgi:hypothetical protein
MRAKLTASQVVYLVEAGVPRDLLSGAHVVAANPSTAATPAACVVQPAAHAAGQRRWSLSPHFWTVLALSVCVVAVGMFGFTLWI